jgi:hypothetical protein
MKKIVNANLAPWPTGNFCILPCVQIFTVGRHANSSLPPELNKCTPACLKLLHHGVRSAELCFLMSAGNAPVNRAEFAHHSMTT